MSEFIVFIIGIFFEVIGLLGLFLILRNVICGQCLEATVSGLVCCGESRGVLRYALHIDFLYEGRAYHETTQSIRSFFFFPERRARHLQEKLLSSNVSIYYDFHHPKRIFVKKYLPRSILQCTVCCLTGLLFLYILIK